MIGDLQAGREWRLRLDPQGPVGDGDDFSDARVDGAAIQADGCEFELLAQMILRLKIWLKPEIRLDAVGL
jgi:hypothetical protein